MLITLPFGTPGFAPVRVPLPFYLYHTSGTETLNYLTEGLSSGMGTLLGRVVKGLYLYSDRSHSLLVLFEHDKFIENTFYIVPFQPTSKPINFLF